MAFRCCRAKPSNYSRLLWMLKNPAYTGAYVLGRTQTVVRRCEDGELVRRRHVVLPELFPQTFRLGLFEELSAMSSKIVALSVSLLLEAPSLDEHLAALQDKVAFFVSPSDVAA